MSELKPQLDYETLNQALFQARIEMSPAEAHGLISGVLCAESQATGQSWVKLILGQLENSSAEAVENLSKLLIFHHFHSDKQLKSDGVEFEILLPSDNHTLTEQVEALADWCKGYLLGLVAGGMEQTASLSTESDEMLKDLIKISEVTVNEVIGSGDEHDFMQLEEYVRVAALTLYDELHAPKPSNQGLDPILH